MCPLIWRFQKYIKRKTRDNAQFILQEASPNAQSVINNPLPRLIDISIPLVGEWIYDKRERFPTYPTDLNFGEFLVKDKAETLPKICLLWGGQLSATHKIATKVVI